MDVCMRPVSPSDTNKENILVPENTANVTTNLNSVDELMDYSEGSDSEKIDNTDMSIIPSQESEILLSDISDSEVQPKEKNTALTGSEPEDGELTYDTEDVLCTENSVANWEPVKVTAEKLAERAKRFGLELSSAPVSKEELLKLYESLDIPLNLVRSGKLRNIRLNTLHMRGVEEMNTTDVIKYFEKYDPMSIEWINDFSCNVIFASDTSAAKAIMGLSSEIITEAKTSKDSSAGHEGSEKDAEIADAQEKKQTNSDDDDMGKVKLSSVAALVETPVPPGKWRLGRSCEKAKSVVLRFATKDDRKIRGSEKRSIYYQKYGNPNYGGLTGLITNSRKRKFTSRRDDDFLSSWVRQQNSRNYNSGFRDDLRRNVEYRDRRTPRSRRYDEDRFRSPLRRTDQQDWSSDSDDDQNILSAGGKKIRMRMYADDVEGTWQKVDATSRPAAVNPKPYQQAYVSGLSDISDEERSQPHSAAKNDVPSRYKIWNPIAENMAREAELAEKAQGYGFSRHQRSYVDNDLRSKIRVPPPEQDYIREVTKGGEGDLRRKLVIKRRGGKDLHRSPLLISVRNKQK